jgi:glucose/arabinose dehydrogenase
VRWGAIAAVLAAVAVVSIGSAAGACRLALDCGIRGGASYRESAEATLDRMKDSPRVKQVRLLRGLRDELVAGGLDLPTDFAFLPDGDVLVAQMDGRIVRVRQGSRRAEPFLDLRDRVSTTYYRGLVALAADPRYRENGYLYVVYALQGPRTEGRDGPTTVRVSRFTAGGGAASERVLLGTDGGGSCDSRPPGADCLPANIDHVGAGLAFGPDGSLFVSTGDGGRVQGKVERASLRAQDPRSLGGKVLRVSRDGLGLPGNPFWTGDPNDNLSKVWATGLRNPFRLTLRPGSGTPWLGDVGESRFEEVDRVPRGANLGWPCYEGRLRNERYAGTEVCRALYGRGGDAALAPVLAVPHRDANSITGGPFVTGAALLPQLRGRYLYADWARGWLRALAVDARGRQVGRPLEVARGLAAPASLRLDASGRLTYLAFEAGELRRITDADTSRSVALSSRARAR